MAQEEKEGEGVHFATNKNSEQKVEKSTFKSIPNVSSQTKAVKRFKIGFVEKSRLLQVKVLLSSDFFFGKILISLGSGFALLPLTKNKSFKCNTAAAAFFISTKFDFLKLCDFKKAADTFPPALEANTRFLQMSTTAAAATKVSRKCMDGTVN